MYTEYLTNAIAENAKRYTDYYNQIMSACQEVKMSTLDEILESEAQLKKIVAALAKAAPKAAQVDVAGYIKDQYTQRIEEHKALVAQEETAFKEQLLQLTKDRKEKADSRTADHDAQVKAAEEAAQAGVKPLIDKHKQLLGYKDKIEDICARYNISPMDIGFADNITAQEFSTLLDAALQGCQQMTKQASSKGNIIAYLYKPLDWQDWKYKLFALSGFAIAFNWVGGLFALAFFFFMISNTVGVYKRLDKLKIASALMYTTDFDKYMEKDKVAAIPEVDLSDLDNDLKESAVKLQEEHNKKMAEFAENDPEAELSAKLQELTKNIGTVDEQVQASLTELKKQFTDSLKKVQGQLTVVMQRREEEIAKLKNLGDGMLDEESHSYPSNQYILGIKQGAIPQRVPVPSGNYHFNSTAPGMLDFVKLMLCNALLDIKEKRLTVVIVDPEGLGKDFAEFFSQDKETNLLIMLEQAGGDNAIAKIKPKITQNIRTCGNKLIDEVNRDFESKGMITMDNYLVIYISGQGDCLRNNVNQQFVETSYKYGARIWDYSSEPVPNMITFDKPYDNVTVEAPLQYTYALGVKCTATYADAVKNSKDGSIDYFKAIQEKYIPKQKWGTWSTLKGIDLNFGLADGDPSKGYPMVLGDANVHLLMAGQSGAGKSAAINQMLLSLVTKYTPKELMLVMVDFKNVEFSTFTVLDEKTGDKISIIPHARILAGTKDGEYALSIFDFLIGEMERRQKLLAEVNQKKLEDYNNLMDDQGHPEKKLPRILLLIDEFQVMFTEVERKIVDKIQDRIRSLAKLARAFGCHMWFTSQSMQGTMSNDVKGNFSMRAALRCTREVSSEIIGNAAAGEIKAKFGYLITNDSTGQDPTKNTTWRVPFVSTKDILRTINEAADLYRGLGIPGYKAVFYDEEQLYADKRLFDFYEKYKDEPKVQNKHLLVLGERTSFSTNPVPVNFYLERGDNQNVMIGATEDVDLLNMCRTIMDNIQAHNLKYIISCADEDAHTLLELDTRLSGKFLEWSYPSIPLADWINPDISPLCKVIDKRCGMEEPNYDPLYVILYNWDKYEGFGVSNPGKMAEKMVTLFRQGPTVDVHFVLIVRAKGEIPGAVYNVFKHRIGCLLDESTSMKFVDGTKCNKLPNKGGYAIYRRGNEESKFKIYQHTFSRKLADKELKL